MFAEALANLTAAVHIAYFTLVVAAFVCIISGPAAWTWTRNLWFRLGHVLAILIVVVEDAGAFACPLNKIEWGLRSPSGAREASTGVGGALDLLLFHTIPGRLLNDLWWGFGVLAGILLVVRPPRRPAR